MFSDDVINCLPDRDDVHDVLRCVQGDPEISALLQLNAAIQTGGAPQLGHPVHCGLTQSAVNPHPGRQSNMDTEKKDTGYTLLGTVCTQMFKMWPLLLVMWMYLGLMYPVREKWDASL